MAHMSRICRAMSCAVPVKPPKIMCEKHWNNVPQEQRNKISDAFTPGINVDNQGSDFNKTINGAVKTLVLIEAQLRQEAARSKRVG